MELEATHRLKSAGLRVARIAILALEATLVTSGLVGAGELLGAFPFWVRRFVPRANVVERKPAPADPAALEAATRTVKGIDERS